MHNIETVIVPQKIKRYVAGFAFDSVFEHVLLIEKTKPEWQAGLCNGIGGKVEPGESDIAAMVREFSEECNISTRPHDWHEYAHLTIRTDHKVGSGDSAHVSFFCTVLPSHHFWEYQSLTEEKVFPYSVNNVVIAAKNFVPNLCWLVPMAIRHLQGNVPRLAHVIEN